jgi:purine-cytosine permease-like protein
VLLAIQGATIVLKSFAVMEVRAFLAYTDADVWRPGIGDPTVMGWITVAAYFFTAFLCFRRFQTTRRSIHASRLFWGGLTLMLVFLGINKQLDLQTWFTLAGKRVAIAQGWYDNRRIVQAVFVALLGAAGCISTYFGYRLVRNHSELRLPLIGFVLLLAFVLARAASFHHIDSLINFRLGGVRMNWVLELGAIALLAMGAWKGRGTGSEETVRRNERWVAAR